MPNLAAVVNDPHFTLVLIDSEQLKYFNLQVKVKARFPVWPCCPDCRHCAERGNELARQHVVFLKHSGRPAAQSFGDVFVGELCVHGLAEKRQGYEFLLFAGFLRLEKGPRAVKADVDSQLNLAFEFADSASVQPQDFADRLADWQVIEPLCEEDDAHVVNDAVAHFACGVRDLERANVFFGFERLVGKGSINDNAVHVDWRGADLELGQLGVGVVSLLCFFFVFFEGDVFAGGCGFHVKFAVKQLI